MSAKSVTVLRLVTFVDKSVSAIVKLLLFCVVLLVHSKSLLYLKYLAIMECITK